MCFVLYAGTEKGLKLRPWQETTPDLSVESLTERDQSIRVHFSKPEVQYIGSTAGCGCDFPHVTLQDGEWLTFEDDEVDAEQEEKEKYNRKALVRLLQESGERMVELYGVWDGDFEKSPKATEDIPLQRILDSNFLFKEQGLYRVKIDI